MSVPRTVLVPALLASLLASVTLSFGCGGDAPDVAAGTAAPSSKPVADSQPAATPPLEGSTSAANMLTPEQVATIDGGLPLTWSDFDRYLGTVYARLPEGDDALGQLVTEAVIDAAAAEAGVSTTDDEIAAIEARLEARAREASGGKLGLQESLGSSVTTQDLRAALRLQALHEQIVRHELGLPADAPLEPSQLKAWVDTHLPGDELEHPPLDDALAARWPGGELTKAQVGKRLRSMLPPAEVSGVLTEMIGVLLVRRESARLGLELTPAEATKEVLDRNTLLHAKAGSEDVSYDQFVETVQKRSLKEVLESDQFGAEVLLRMISERAWTEDSARAEWEAHPEKFPAPTPPVAKTIGAPTASPATPPAPEPRDWEHMRATVWRALRQDSYAQLFQQSRIVRRF